MSRMISFTFTPTESWSCPALRVVDVLIPMSLMVELRTKLRVIESDGFSWGPPKVPCQRWRWYKIVLPSKTSIDSELVMRDRIVPVSVIGYRKMKLEMDLQSNGDPKSDVMSAGVMWLMSKKEMKKPSPCCVEKQRENGTPPPYYPENMTE